jgi:hypothetical protein
LFFVSSPFPLNLATARPRGCSHGCPRRKVVAPP